MTMTLERELEIPVSDPSVDTFRGLIASSLYPKPFESLGNNPLKMRRLRQAAEACYALTYIAAGAATRTIAERNSEILVADNYLRFKAGEQLEGGFEVWRNQFGYLDALYEQARFVDVQS